MQDLVNLCVNNGLGVLSFVILVILGYKILEKYNDTLIKVNETMSLQGKITEEQTKTLEKFNETMILQNKTSEEQTRALEKMQESIVALTSRIDNLENKIDKEG